MAIITRRDFLRFLAGSGCAVSLPGCAAQSLHLRSENFPPFDHQTYPFLGLTQSLKEEYDYEAAIDGSIPGDLRGVLYRNTTGLLERGGYRKRTLFDGDGMIQAFFFEDHGVRFRNRYVQTEKYREESMAGTFLYPTFSTQAPGGVLANFFAGDQIKSQAQISVVVRNGRLYAFDESAQPYELDCATLQTRGVSFLGLPEGTSLYGAHSKIDVRTGEWFLFGLHYGRRVTLHITIFKGDGSLREHRTVTLPRYVHIHDFHLSERYMIFHLHPFELNVFPFLFGLASMLDCITWKPEKGNLVMILDRYGGSSPVFLQTEASFMWHSVNAYDAGELTIADFVGYEHPDHVLGQDSPIVAIMRGEAGHFVYPGEIRRYVINMEKKTLRQEVMFSGNYEWPAINLVHRCYPYRFLYAAATRKKQFFWSGISRFDMKRGAQESYFFDKGLYCSEPVFIPRPGVSYRLEDDGEQGWILTEVYNGNTKRSCLSIFAADRIADGPVATVHLRHHVPYSMHGFWYNREQYERDSARQQANR